MKIIYHIQNELVVKRSYDNQNIIRKVNKIYIIFKYRF